MKSKDFAVAPDGVRLHYAVQGNGPIRIALTHSLAMSGDFWAPVVAALGESATILTWDCRGHGASDKPAGPYSVELFADDLAAVFQAAGWERALCAGASMGGTVTLAFAARYPERVLALGLIDTTASYGVDAPRAWEERAVKAKAEGLASLAAFQTTRWFSDGWRQDHPDLVEHYVALFLANEIDAYVETCRMLGCANVTPALSRFSVPTTILVGEEDYATPPAMAQAMHSAIAGSELEIIPGARHLTPLECPELIATRLQDLARKVAQ